MRTLCFGAGALGTYIAGSLALHGSPTVFLERPEVAEELREKGLRLALEGRERRIPVIKVVDTLEQALEWGPFDVAIFALKSFDTQPALISLAPYANELPPLLCLQNGVDNEPVLAEALGQGKVIAGTVTSSISRRGAGEVVLERLRGVGVAAGYPLSERLVQELDKAGLNARLYEDAAGMKWSKLLTNLVANASSAILDMPPAMVFAHPGLFRLELEQLRECLKVMEAHRFRTVDLPGTPVRALAFAVQRLPPALARPMLARAVGSGRGSKMPSFHIDLHTGRGQSEVDYLNGAVVRAGLRYGIPTPANLLLTNTLLGLTAGMLAKEDFARRPERLLEMREHL